MFKELLFNKIFDAIVCLNADLPGMELFEIFRDTPILAADGAASFLISNRIFPDFIIGDLDSFNDSNYTNTKTKIISIPSQDSNDFEKTLHFAKNQGFHNLLIVGIHGGLYEHSLNNWSVLMRYAYELNLCIYEKKRYGIPVFESIKLATKINEIISIIPNQQAKITTHNLEWKLDNEYLTFSEREGGRNKATANVINIELHAGSYLLFIDNRLPNAPCLI